MAFPTTIDSFTSPVSTDYLNSPAHSTQHSNVNTAINEIEKKMGTGASNASAATSSSYLKADGAGASSWQVLTINRAFGWFIPGTPSVANDLSWNPVSPQAMTAVKIWAYIKTAPTGASFIVRIYNITQAAVVGSVTILASAQTGNSTTFTTAAIAAGNVLQVDVTQVGSTINGADVSVVLECTQP